MTATESLAQCTAVVEIVEALCLIFAACTSSTTPDIVDVTDPLGAGLSPGTVLVALEPPQPMISTALY